MKGFIFFLALLTLISAAIINTSSPPSSTIDTDPVQCVNQKCPTQNNACQNDASCPITVSSCYQKCGNNQTCWTTCVYDNSIEPTFSVVTCAFAYNCLELENPLTCLDQNCPTKLEDCSKDPECESTLYQCFDRCKNQSQCWTQCVEEIRNLLALQLSDCAFTNKCLGAVKLDPIECVQQTCSYQLSACQQDPNCEPLLYTCYGQCAGDQDCWNKCLQGVVIQSAVYISKCGLKQSCFDPAVVGPIICLSEKCPSEYANCGTDPQCAPTAQNCYSKCLNDPECWEYCLSGTKNQMSVAVANCAFADNCLSP